MLLNVDETCSVQDKIFAEESNFLSNLAEKLLNSLPIYMVPLCTSSSYFSIKVSCSKLVSPHILVWVSFFSPLDLNATRLVQLRAIMGNAIKGHIQRAEKTGVCQLASMNLTEFPPQLLRLVTNLRTLDLSQNKITILPEAIGDFKALKTLNLSSNHLASLCLGICKLNKLETLTINNNRLTSLPKDLDRLVALKTVLFSGNRLTSFPEELCKLKNLSSLDLSKNSITRIPDSIESIQVVELNLNQNKIKVIPIALASCPRLKVLRFEENLVSLDGFASEILTDSSISLIAYEGNMFGDKDFQSIAGYDKYMERYTATKKKFD